MSHDHSFISGALFGYLAIMVLGLAAVGYVAGLWASRSHGRWPIHRTVLWYAGVFCAGAGLVGPVAEAARTNFSAHMVGHLLLGMIGPLCLSLSAPVTLALRALPVAKARKLSRLLRTVLVRGLTHPVVTVVLNAGGLWALYTEMMDAGSGGGVARRYTDARRGCLPVDLSAPAGAVNRAARRSMT